MSNIILFVAIAMQKAYSLTFNNFKIFFMCEYVLWTGLPLRAYF